MSLTDILHKKLGIFMYTLNTADVNKMTKNMQNLNEVNYILANPVDLFYVDTLV